jgi:DNA-directed RNA polymerase specialized sigma24 family protein
VPASSSARAFVQRHPRARLQLAALWLKHVEGLDETAISQRLGKPAGSLYVLRARALQKLRAEPAWRALAAEAGLLPQE